MGKLVQVDGIGPVEFADNFTEAEIAQQVQGLYRKQDLRSQMQSARTTGRLADAASLGVDFLTGAAKALTFSPATVLDVTEQGVEGAASALTGSPQQLLTHPSELMRTPLFKIPDIPTTKETPVAGQVAAGVGNAAIEFANFLQTPEFVAYLGIGGLPVAARQAVSAGIAGNLASQAPQQFNEALDAARKGDWTTAAKQVTSGLGTTAMSAAAAHGGLEHPQLRAAAPPPQPINPRAQSPNARGQRPPPAKAGPESVTLDPLHQRVWEQEDPALRSEVLGAGEVVTDLNMARLIREARSRILAREWEQTQSDKGTGRTPPPPPASAPVTPPVIPLGPVGTAMPSARRDENLPPPEPAPSVTVPSVEQPATPAVVPDRPATLAAQINLVRDGTKPAMLITPRPAGDSPVAIPSGLASFDAGARGTLVFDPQRIAPATVSQLLDQGEPGLAQLLGYGATKEQAAATTPPGVPPLVLQTSKNGVPVHEELVSPTTLPAAVQAARRVAPDGVMTLKTADQITLERLGESPATTALDHAAIPTVEFPLTKIVHDESVIPNFKAGSNPKTGEVSGQELSGKFERKGVAPVILWERLDGTVYDATGRHRIGLAKRSGETTIPAQVLREADGYTRESMMSLDAEANIRDGQGEVADYATYFKGVPELTQAEAQSRGLLSRVKGRAGFSLARSASDDLYSLWRAGKLDEKQAVAIAQTAPGNAGLQALGVKQALKGKSPADIANFMRVVESETRGGTADQFDMFGRDDAALRQAEEMAARASQMQSGIADQIRAVQSAAKRPEAAAKLGVNVGDPEGVLKRVGELKIELERWQNWSLHPDLVAEVRSPKSKAQSPTEAASHGFNVSIGGQPAVMTQPGMVQIGKQKAESRNAGELASPAYHGTPHEVDQFSTAKIGTGEGAQVYGWGLYFAENPEVAKSYRDQLTPKRTGVNPFNFKHDGADYTNVGGVRQKDGVSISQSQYALAFRKAQERFDKLPNGNEYTVDLKVKPEELLDWDKPLSEQSPKVRDAIIRVASKRPHTEAIAFDRISKGDETLKGRDIYSAFSTDSRSAAEASERLNSLGIKGIRYLDQGSRRNFRIVPANETTSGKWVVAEGGDTIARFNTEAEARARLAAEQAKQTFNYVIFDESRIKITHKNGVSVETAVASPGYAELDGLARGIYGRSFDVLKDDQQQLVFAAQEAKAENLYGPQPPNPAERRQPVADGGQSAVARSLTEAQSQAIGNAIVDRLHELRAQIKRQTGLLNNWGKTTAEHRDLLAQIRYHEGRFDALEHVLENFKDSPQTRKGEVFASPEFSAAGGEIGAMASPGFGVSALDKRINKLREAQAAGNRLTLSQEEQLRRLETQRGQEDLFSAPQGEGVPGRITELRAQAEEATRQAKFEVERGNNSTHRYEEHFANAQTYYKQAETLRQQAHELERRLGLGEVSSGTPETAPETGALPRSPQMDMFASPPSLGGGELGGEPPRGAREKTAPIDDPRHSVLDAVPIGMQEMVQLAKAFTGVYPKVKEFIRALGGEAAGVFKFTQGEGGKGRIEIKAGTFEVLTREEFAQLREQAKAYAENNSRNASDAAKLEAERYDFLVKELRQRVLPERHAVEALKVMAHEIGHVVDWLPDHIIRGRGNFFGRIASLKNYLKHVLPLDPKRIGPFQKKPNAAEHVKLRAEAERQVREEIGPIREIVRQIITEEPEWRITGIRPEDVTNILRESAGKETPELTRWFAEQDSKVKAEVLRKAMRGLLDERLAAMGKKEQIGVRKTVKTVREKVGREPTPQEIKQRFAELLAAEMKARNLAQLETVKREMAGAIAWWRGTETMPDYFKTGHEMYAEAFSMFFNNPAGFEKRAPTAARLLWNYLDAKPEVQKLYDEIQRSIKSGEIFGQRVRHLQEMWDRDDVASLVRGRESRSAPSWRDFYANVAYHLDRRMGPLYRVAKGEHQGPLRDAIGNWLYRATEHEQWLAENNRTVGKTLAEANLDWQHDLGEYLYHQRVIKERFNAADGTPLANPLGWDAKDSTARLDEMQTTLGAQKWAALESAAKQFYEQWQKYPVATVTEARMFSPELNKVILDRAHYVTFAAVRHLPDTGIERIIETQYGAQATPHIYSQRGNLGESKNPATATMLKGLSLISAAHRNTMKREFISALKAAEEYPGQLAREAVTEWTGRTQRPRVVDGPKVGTILYLEDGQAKGFYVNKLAADAVNGDAPLPNHLAAVGQRTKGLLKGIFTQQPGFWLLNAIRDVGGSVVQLPGARAPLVFPLLLPRAFKAARATVTGRYDPIAERVLGRKELISRSEQAGSWAEVRDEYEHAISGYGLNPAAWNRELSMQERALKVWHEWMGWGKAIERTTKIATDIYLESYAPARFRNSPDWLKREWVREIGGSPDFLQRGKSAGTVDWFFLFYNPWKEGIRSVVRAARTDPIGFGIKTAGLMVMPTVLQALAYNGAFGDDVKKRYRAVKPYQLANYLIPWVGWSNKEQEQVLHWRLPMPEAARNLHGLLFQLLTNQHGLLDHLGGNTPGLNPIIASAWQWYSYLRGQNPMDFHRGVNVLTDQQQAARGGAHGLPGDVLNGPALSQMFQQTWNNLGGGVLYQAKNLNLEDPPQTDWQKRLAAPLGASVGLQSDPLGSIIGRMVKVSSATKEQAALAAHDTAQMEAKFQQTRAAMVELIVQRLGPALQKKLKNQSLTTEESNQLHAVFDWPADVKNAMHDPRFMAWLQMTQQEFERAVAIKLGAQNSPALKALEVGTSRLQDAAILRSLLENK